MTISNLRRVILCCGAPILALIPVVASAQTGARTALRPNIVLIVADDLGWKDVGYQGSDVHEPPNIDASASRDVGLARHPVPFTPHRRESRQRLHPESSPQRLALSAAGGRGSTPHPSAIARPAGPQYGL